MIKFIIVAAIAWLLGVFGWAQIIGSIQNLYAHRKLLFTLILWTIIMGVGGYFAIAILNSLWALLVGYGVSFLQVISSGKIE